MTVRIVFPSVTEMLRETNKRRTVGPVRRSLQPQELCCAVGPSHVADGDAADENVALHGRYVFRGGETQLVVVM
jgi:hypothetical protein